MPENPSGPLTSLVILAVGRNTQTGGTWFFAGPGDDPDIFVPTFDGIWPVVFPSVITFTATHSGGEYIIDHHGEDVSLFVPADAPEGAYTISGWTYRTYLINPADITDIVEYEAIQTGPFTVHIIRAPLLGVSASTSARTAMMQIFSASYPDGLAGGYVDWGDSHRDRYTYAAGGVEVDHEYADYGTYTVTTVLQNRLGKTATSTVKITLRPTGTQAMSSEMYLLGADGLVSHPLDFVSWRITQNAGKSKITVSTPDHTIHPGMYICIQPDLVPFLFLVESVAGIDDVTATGIDLASAAAIRRIAVVGTDTGAGQDTYDTVGGHAIPQILTRNVGTPERAIPMLVPPSPAGIGRECHLHARYGQVSKLYTDAITTSGLSTWVRALSTAGGVAAMVEIGDPRDTSILLAPINDSGTIKRYAENAIPTCCYAAGKGTGSQRTVRVFARPEALSGGFARYETYVDASSTSDSAAILAAAQAHLDSIGAVSAVFEIWPTLCPYRFAPATLGGDLWVGDQCDVDCGPWGIRHLRITQIDWACSAKNGKTCEITLGDTGVGGSLAADVHTIQTSGIPNRD